MTSSDRVACQASTVIPEPVFTAKSGGQDEEEDKAASAV